MKYDHLHYHRSRKKLLRRFYILMTIVAIGILGFFGKIFYDNFQASNYNSPEQTTSGVTSSTIVSDVQIFRSPYFQFQANKTWNEDSANSSEGKYVYKSIRNGLIEHQLTIYVNNAPQDVGVTRVLATVAEKDGGLGIVAMSDHCSKAPESKGSAAKVTLEQVTFPCFGDDTRYTALVGLQGGTTNMSLVRPDGTQASYVIQYANVTAHPDSIQLEEIVGSFQTR